LRHPIGSLNDGRVLDRRGDEVIAGVQQAEDRRVVASVPPELKTPRRRAVEEFCHRLASLIDTLVRLLSVQVDRGGVAEVLHPIGRIDSITSGSRGVVALASI